MTSTVSQVRSGRRRPSIIDFSTYRGSELSEEYAGRYRFQPVVYAYILERFEYGSPQRYHLTWTQESGWLLNLCFVGVSGYQRLRHVEAHRQAYALQALGRFFPNPEVLPKEG